jgi:3-phosphoshikimate 1-carboxyvinyltransferase
MNRTKIKPLHGTIYIPGDKSISHRSIMCGSLAKGKTEISNFLRGEDCLSTISCFRNLGIEITEEKDRIYVNGKGLHGLEKSSQTLYTGNSGTTTRLLTGILAGQSFSSSINGDSSIQKRPMKRVIDPLTQMNAKFICDRNEGYVPYTVSGGDLKGICYHTPVASAQVKSAILFAGLYADSPTTVIEPATSRNHTEVMLKGFGANLDQAGKNEATLYPCNELFAQKIHVPGDISSAAYFIAAALIIPNSEVRLKNVGINITRSGLLQVVEAMGGNITYENEQMIAGERTADLIVKHSELIGTTIEGDIIPTLIDEIPIIAVLATFAKGKTIVKDAAELKVKESDRIHSITKNLSNMGADITPTDDGMIIEGGKSLHVSKINTYMDHRIAMSFYVALLAIGANDTYLLDFPSCVSISYPSFFDTFKTLL